MTPQPKNEELTTDSIEFVQAIPDEIISAMNQSPYAIEVYEVHNAHGWKILTGSANREWMAANGNHAYRCLPLTIANQAGWLIHSPVSFTAVWDGGVGKGSLRIECIDPLNRFAGVVRSHFGNGIITFNLPYLFRSVRKDIQLSVRGMPNEPKPGATALEGVVEIGWLPFTFTMNWKVTDINRPVQFVKGEPICFIQPISLDIIESASPVKTKMEEGSKLKEQFEAWDRMRAIFNSDPKRRPEEWQKFYHAGPGGDVDVPHRTSVQLMEFK